jgi:hypothetical protein
MTTFVFFPNLLHVLKWGLLWDERTRGREDESDYYWLTNLPEFLLAQVSCRKSPARLWDRSVDGVNLCWPSSAQSFFVPTSAGLDTDGIENTASSSSSILGCFSFHGMVFTEPLPSTCCPLWLHYFGFQSSCHVAPFLLRWCPSLPSLMALQCHGGHDVFFSFFTTSSFRSSWVGISRCSSQTAPSLELLVSSRHSKVVRGGETRSHREQRDFTTILFSNKKSRLKCPWYSFYEFFVIWDAFKCSVFGSF